MRNLQSRQRVFRESCLQRHTSFPTSGLLEDGASRREKVGRRREKLSPLEKNALNWKLRSPISAGEKILGRVKVTRLEEKRRGKVSEGEKSTWCGQRMN